MVEALDNSQTVDGAQASAAAAGDGMADTINNRAHAPGEIDTSMAKQGMGQEAVDADSWIEVRLQGKLPERRSNHCAFILAMKDGEYLYVHGGRDLKEGPIATMWKVNLTGIQQLFQDPYHKVEWEQVETQGKGPGSISHHTAFVMGTKEVLFYGGSKGEDSNAEIFIFNATTTQWQTIHLAEAAQGLLPRDDHALSDCYNGSFIVFGGFVNGSRVNEVLKFMPSSVAVNGEMLAGADTGIQGPIARASHSSAIYNEKLYIFGGQDDENNKLGDLWEFDLNSCSWQQIIPQEGEYVPIARSGHSAVVRGDKMYIFGGIYELTKELNDTVVFDFSQMRFLQGEEPPEFLDGSPDKMRSQIQQDNFNDSSPTRTNKGGSPGRRKTLGFGTSVHAGSSPLRSPAKRRLMSPTRKDRGDIEKQDGLGTPTSISMQNRFIIKNADPSFDQYYQQMKKRKQHGFGATEHGGTNHGESKFGLIKGSKPTARDGHIAVVDSQGFMYVFGGDRHLMPFNDLYMIELA